MAKKKTKNQPKKKQVNAENVIGLHSEVTDQPITQTLEVNYMPYAMSVNVSRAFPEIDGFKPSHRKLLYTMYKMGLLKGERQKSANIVGQTMKLNPHGDAAIYETMVRLATGNEALLAPFVESKGNFGKYYSGDLSYAASRYTEAKLSPISAEIFKDIDKDPVDFVDSYDGAMKEPRLLPTTFPNILVSANKGIGVAMASDICGFNLNEVCAATMHYLKDPDCDLLEYMPMPDFSTGGEIIYRREEMEKIIETGLGSFQIRSRWRWIPEERIIEVYEIPYTTKTDVIIERIVKLSKEGKVKEIHTRFPPEPNGYLHIGSAKAIYINYMTAKTYGGKFNLRFDDTNPAREGDEYVQSILKDLEWLGATPNGGIFYGSDYFEKCYEYAEKLIQEGKAYVDDLTREEMQEYRGNDAGKPSRPSPYRDRTPEENLDLFRRMRAGEFADGEKTLRAKIDLASPNMNLRDPAIYRIKHVSHHRQGDKWCIYPLYDFAHPIQDAIEGITHSMCSLEFENHRPLYEWVVTNIFGAGFPKQREFARLNVTNTVMSKRYLRELVEKNIVDGWDDPRMPTLCGLRRRGYTPTSIFEFVRTAGVAKADSLVDMRQLEAVLRAELELNAARRVAVLEPVKLVIDNYPADQVEYFDLPNNPNRDANDTTTRPVAFTKEVWIDKSDFFEVPPPKFKRLTLGSEVRLMGAYLVRCTGVDKDEAGNVVTIHAEADLETRNGNPADGRKVRGTIHWVSCEHCVDAEIHLYDKLFTEANMNGIPDGADFKDYLNPDSVQVIDHAKLEESLADAKPGERFQFVRTGYFTPDSKNPHVYNRIVTLKDSFKF